MFYRHSPFQLHPLSYSWVPYLLTPEESHHRTNNTDLNGQSIKENAMTTTDSSVIYQDRNVRIQHKDDKIVYTIDMPGIKPADAKVEIHNGVLSIQAERKDGNNFSKYAQHFLVKESDVDSQNIRANLIDGVMTISIPKKEEMKPIIIPIAADYPPEKEKDATKDVRFSVDLPGVKASDAKLELKDDTISLHATRKVFDKSSTYDRYFSIDRSKVDPTSFSAYLADGVLTITGTKKDVPEPKPIVVTTSPTQLTIEEKSKEDTEMVVVETVPEEKKK